ncbi:MAG TPA: hypothetical protein VIU63_00840, partial [Nitrospira sp.]
AEMDTGFQQFFDCDDSHAFTSSQGLQSTREQARGTSPLFSSQATRSRADVYLVVLQPRSG